MSFFYYCCLGDEKEGSQDVEQSGGQLSSGACLKHEEEDAGRSGEQWGCD